MFAKLEVEKISSDDCHAIDKEKSKRAEEMELAKFYNEPINLPQFFKCKVYLAEDSKLLFLYVARNIHDQAESHTE